MGSRRQLALLAGVPLIALAPWWFHHPTLVFCLAAIAIRSVVVLAQARPASRLG